MIYSFPPVIDTQSEVLILGTMPGIASLEAEEYYAHPRNHFWPILYKLFKQEPLNNFSDKKDFLLKNKIALWDCLHHCEREGSLDNAIKEEIPNDLISITETYTNIRKIYLNGQKAGQLYKKHFAKNIHLPYQILPSTSPANARMSFEQKMSSWKSIYDK